VKDEFPSQQQPQGIPNLPLTLNYVEGIITLHEHLNFHKQLILIHDPTHLLAHYLQAEAVSKSNRLIIDFVDCLDYRQVDTLLEEGNEYVDESEEEEENSEQERRVVVLLQLENCPNFLRKFR
jgi:hypothetical protein